ncbi:lipoprotein [Maricurvus nonylphenolicus]|uniref:BPSL1445 family SYLF domain-containing lipoprotein n=1 Tax=Maricurvus nonylphenolicus TaxID=1008307 RepID=UPI0036F1C484
MRVQYLLTALLLACLSNISLAASKVEIDARIDATLNEFYQHVPEGKALARKAKGVLIFPQVIKAGVGIGGEYGEGALQIGGKPVAYYSTAGASIGFQLGAQMKSQIILFMDTQTLQQFRNSEGWKVGVDGSVAIAEFGAGKDLDSNTLKQPVIGFIFSNKGLMYDLSLEGSKFTRIIRE